MRDKVYETDYRRDRRRRRHRCRACWCTIDDNARVLGAKVSNRATWFLHIECAETSHSETLTWRGVFNAWAK